MKFVLVMSCDRTIHGQTTTAVEPQEASAQLTTVLRANLYFELRASCNCVTVATCKVHRDHAVRAVQQQTVVLAYNGSNTAICTPARKKIYSKI